MIYNYRIYLDSISELLVSYHEYVSRPPRYIIHTPVLFDEWKKWADKKVESNIKTKQQMQHNNEIPIMGIKNAPDWVLYEFDNLEDFYKHYTSLTVYVPDEELV